jgi:hypothetical protein
MSSSFSGRTPVVKINKALYAEHFGSAESGKEAEQVIENLLEIRKLFLESFGHDPSVDEVKSVIGKIEK